MAEVAITFKVFPESVEAFDSVKAAIQKMAPKGVGEEPIAFGLKAVRVTFVVDDESGGSDALEAKLQALEGVSQIETVSVGRL